LERLVLPAKVKTFGSTNITWTNDDGMSFKFISAPVFGNCTSLKYVDMSACVDMTLIPSELFQNCYSIETLLLPPNLTKICDLAFGTREEYAGLRSLKEIVIPASVTTIGGYAFNGCSSLETVIFAEGSPITELGVQELEANNFVSGANIFAGTTNLKTLVLPKNLTLIGISCFEGSGVTELKLPITVTTIGARAFYNCANIVKAELTANLVYLGDEAFSGCGKLEEANLYFGLEYLGAQAFAYSGLKNAYIPATVTSMSGNPFAGCMSIESITLDNDNIDFKLVDGVLYDNKMFTLIYYPANLTADTFHIPDTVHEIASGAFAGAQLSSLTIPYRITEIPDYAFQNSALETITLHRGIKYLGNYAFAGMKNLKQLFVSNVELQMEMYTFADLAGDVDIYFYEHTKEEIVKMCGNDVWFTNASETANFYFKDTMPEGIVIPQ